MYAATRVTKRVAASMNFTLISLLGFITPKGDGNRFGTGKAPIAKKTQV
jgi:hypothetical protein